jgi:mannose/fructose/N-acetylgalactosamine-specific phosphotransferase system component IIB
VISVFRIDDRLIHAQVLIGWGRVINPDRFIVINDQVAGDQLKRQLYLSAVPPQYQLSILTLKEAAEQLKADIYAKEKIIVLVKSPRDVVNLLDSGVSIKEVNVGGMHYSEGKTKVLEDIYLSLDDREALRNLGERGIRLEARPLPDSNPVVINTEDI